MMKKIFTAIFIICAMGAVPAMAVDDGCSKDGNNLINPILALCSTHAYNAATSMNEGKNFYNDSDRQNQREIIAAKTTIITQQMKQQYDYLNATVRRLKTQLQKAVLTTSLEAAGASSDKSGSSSYNSNNRNIILAGAQDCTAQNGEVNVLNCLQSNQVHIRAAISAGNYNDAWNQLKADVTIATRWPSVKSNLYEEGKKWAENAACKKVLDSNKSRATLENCLNDMNVAIGLAMDNKNGVNAEAQAIMKFLGRN